MLHPNLNFPHKPDDFELKRGGGGIDGGSSRSTVRGWYLHCRPLPIITDEYGSSHHYDIVTGTDNHMSTFAGCQFDDGTSLDVHVLDGFLLSTPLYQQSASWREVIVENFCLTRENFKIRRTYQKG